MGFRYRKSINLGGGFRINLSKSGVGYSWGTKGYRVTKTARGTTRKTYSIPGTGLSYTTESGGSKTKSRKQRNCEPSHGQEKGFEETNNTSIHNIREIQSGDVTQFQTVEATNIIKAINRTISMNRWGNMFIWCVFLMFINPVLIILPIVGIVLKIIARTKAVVELEYSFDAEAMEEYTRRIDAWIILAEGDKEWQITTEQHNSNTRVNAGASRSLGRVDCKIKKGRPFYICTNVETVEVKLKKENLIILPDKVFVIRGKKVGLVDYKDFNISVSSTNFVESEPVPKDARVIGSTWQFVNKNGTPDRRYKNNKQLPICLYGTVRLSSASGAGINVELMISNIQKAQDFKDLVI